MEFRNIKLIIRYLNKLVLIGGICFSILFFFIDTRFIASMWIGLLFSYVIFNQLFNSQKAILVQKKKGVFFIYYCLRLIVYAIPVVLTLYFKNYLNIFIVLVFLFTYQVLYISIEFNRSLKKIKR